MDIHVVKSGDNMYAIAQAYSVSMAQLICYNQLEDPANLVVGQTILIPYPKTTHCVVAQDTLADLAKNYDTTVNTILRNNPQLGGWENLTIGQELVIAYEEQGKEPKYVNAYAYPHIDRALFHQTLPYLSTIAPFTHRFTTEGNLVTLNDGYLQWAGEKVGVETLFHLASVNENGGFSTALSNAVLSSAEKQVKLMDAICQQVEKKKYAGVDVDFELIDPEYALAYVEFLENLKERLGTLPLFVAVAPKTSAKQGGIFYEGHRYKELGQVCDGILLMTYEWGYPEGEPMAVSPITGVRQVLDYAITEIPPEKLILGIPTYGYNWRVPKKLGEKATSLTCPQAVSLARQFHAEICYDTVSQAPYFHYTDDLDQTHTVWFEDARSILAKWELVEEYGLKGVGYWNLDRPFPQNWGVLNSLVSPLLET